jgi:hypothetical protein
VPVRFALASIVFGVIAVHNVACSSDTSLQWSIIEPGGASSASGSTTISGGSGGATTAGSPVVAGGSQAVLNPGGAVVGGRSMGGTSASSGGTAIADSGSSGAGQAGAPGDGGPQSSCSASLSGEPCQPGASCDHVAPDGCSAVNCVCISGKWACAESTQSCGKCLAAREAHCGDPCSAIAQDCLCQCGGSNFTSCSCSGGAWQCLGC